VPLDDEDVREILRIIDESELDEIHVETEGLSLHVVRGGAARSDPVELDVEGAQVPDEAGDAVTIVAPMPGTFYRAPAPGAAPFVELGAAVEPSTIVCIIEVMKMMNSVHAGVTGTIADVWVENGEPVEYGTPLFRVVP
jgi:biotin carboxyl carrier protein